MALNAFIKLGNAFGEAMQGKYGAESWTEIQGWDWEVEAETSWTRGGGASVGKPSPGKLNFEHYYDRSAPTILAYICLGKSFDQVTLEMCKTTGGVVGGPERGLGLGKNSLEPFFTMRLTDAFITKVSNTASDDGNVVQKVEMVFKKIEIDYRPQGMPTGPGAVGKDSPGKLGPPIKYEWNISAGTASGGT